MSLRIAYTDPLSIRGRYGKSTRKLSVEDSH